MKRLLKSKKRLFISVVCLVVAVFVLVNIAASFFLGKAILKKDGWKKFEEYSYAEQLSGDFEWIEQKSERICIENEDGKELCAENIQNEHKTNSYVIVCHQYGGSPATMSGYAKHFYGLGFNVIMPHLRGHADSPYSNISFGWKDRYDIVEWIDFVTEKDPEARIVLFGISLGANAVTLAACEELPQNVKMVISDSCYGSMKDLVKRYVKNETIFSSLIVTGLVGKIMEAEIGEEFKKADTATRVGDIEIPIVFINGEEDTVVPPLISKRFYENCDAEGVEEVLVADGTHGKNIKADKKDYWNTIDGFILSYLGI